MVKLQYFILLISTAVSVYAGGPVDSGSLSLRIRNASKQSVIPWGKVTIKGPISKYHIVDTNGEVLFFKVPSGSYIVKAEANGFQTETMKMNLDFSEKQELDGVIKLTPNPPVVFGKKKKFPQTPEPRIPEPQIEVPSPEKAPVEVTVQEQKESEESVQHDSKGINFQQMPKAQPRKETSNKKTSNNVKNEIMNISINYNNRDGLVAKNPGSGMIVTGIVGSIALIVCSVIMTLIVLRWKKTPRLLRMAFSGCGCTFALICILAWVLFIGFAIVMFDVNVKKAVASQKSEENDRREALPFDRLEKD